MTGQNIPPIAMDATASVSQGNNKGRDNYFQASIKKYGPNFHHSKTLQMLQYDAKHRLFREMVEGKINYDEFGIYFTDPQYLDILIAQAQSLFHEHDVISNALLMFYDQIGGPIPQQLGNRHRNVANVFFVITQQLNAVKATNYNIQYLTSIAGSCAGWAKDFKELY